jgi:hypothetical protein
MEKQAPDCINIPHKDGTCWWCNMIEAVLNELKKKKQG